MRGNNWEQLKELLELEGIIKEIIKEIVTSKGITKGFGIIQVRNNELTVVTVEE